MGWQPAFFPEVQRKTLGIVQLQSRFAWGFTFVTGVSPPTLALVYNTVEHNLSEERPVEDWPLLFWRKKVGVFRHCGTHGHLAVEMAQPGGTYKTENCGGIEPIAKLLMFWFNSFWKFEASVFFVGGGKGWVGGEEGQRLE